MMASIVSTRHRLRRPDPPGYLDEEILAGACGDHRSGLGRFGGDASPRSALAYRQGRLFRLPQVTFSVAVVGVIPK